MTLYIRVPRIKGREAWYNLIPCLCPFGIDEVEYNDGGWSDHHLSNVAPHLKFDNHSDALVCALALGLLISTELPVKVIKL